MAIHPEDNNSIIPKVETTEGHKGDDFKRSGESGVNSKSPQLQCHLCLRVFSSKAGCLMHIKVVHEKIRDHPCEKCDRPFPTKARLKRHVKAIHDQIRDRECPACGKMFSRADHLSNHQKTHGEKPLKEHREETGLSSLDVPVHKRAVHDKRKNVKRDLCSRVFSPNPPRHLQSLHEQLEEGKRQDQLDKAGFKCEECGKLFSRKYSLSRHANTVHKKGVSSSPEELQYERNHPCQRCSLSFVKESTLTRHLAAVHASKQHKQKEQTAVQPDQASVFQCGMCLEKFDQKETISLHMQRAHL